MQNSRVGVLAWLRDGRPAACAVTPLTAGDGRPVITSTLAMTAKMHQIHRSPRVALLAGGTHVAADADVLIDRDGTVFRDGLLQQEAAKFPPTARLLALPGHRRWLWWYFGRVIATLTPRSVVTGAGPDHTVLVTLRDDRPLITSLPGEGQLDVRSTVLDLGLDHLPDGPAVLLAHREDPSMTTLAQLRVTGELTSGRLNIKRRNGSLDIAPAGPWQRMRELRRLARRAKANTEHLRQLETREP